MTGIMPVPKNAYYFCILLFITVLRLPGFGKADSMAYSGRKAEFTASEGILQSPLGERETEPTLGPSGIHERLNCCAKKRRMNTFSHLSTVSAAGNTALQSGGT